VVENWLSNDGIFYSLVLFVFSQSSFEEV
jgi:hypothetical protein